MTSFLRAAGWNPQWATGGRFQEIADTTMSIDVTLLTDTQNACMESTEVLRRRVSGRLALEQA
eukprot:6071933-Pyramimonas_sp.AAC.1